MSWKVGMFFPLATLALIFAGAVLVFADVRPDRTARPLDQRIPGQYIVVLKDSVSDVEFAESEILSRTRGERIASYRSAVRGFAARFSDSEIESVKNDPRVLFVSEDRVVSIDQNARPIRPEIVRQRDDRDDGGIGELSAQVVSSAEVPAGVDRVDADGVENVGEGVHVAVVDTGIYLNHPDLKDNIVGGVKCVNASGGYTDQNGHGTHVAGTIAALNNGSGVVGIAPAAKLWSVRVLDRKGGGSWSSVICGIDFVTSNAPANGGPIKVANLSLSGSGTSDNNCGNSNNDALHRAICKARDAGVTVVVAAGNSASDSAYRSPASYNDAVITVSALTDTDGKPGGLGSNTYYGADDTFASFSNWGAPVDIGAPGVGIYSTWLYNGYRSISGTSMAAPHVAGAAALYLSAKPNAPWSEVRDALISSGEKLGNGHSDPSGRHPENVLQVDSLSLLWGSSVMDPTPPPVEEPPAEESPIEEPVPEPEPTPPAAEDYFESFENGLSWTNDSQRDWKTSRQRATDGRYSLEVDGRANDAAITSDTINLGGKTSATVSFDWYIERKVDRGEYIAFDVSKDGGSSWQEMKLLKGNVDSEDTWHSESFSVTGISSLKIRFRGSMSSSSEDANVDSVKVVAN